MSNELTIKAMHAEIDAYGVRRGVKIKTPTRDTAQAAAAALSETKRGNAEFYRVCTLAMIAAAAATGAIMKGDRSMDSRRRHVEAGRPGFTIDLARFFPDKFVWCDRRQRMVPTQEGWNDGAFLTMWMGRNVHRAGVPKWKVVTYRDVTLGHHKFWVLVTD